MSDTPRSDFVAHENGDIEWNRPINRFGRMFAHAQILERELSDAKRDADRYRILRNGSKWPAVFDSFYAVEPLRDEELDESLDNQIEQKRVWKLPA